MPLGQVYESLQRGVIDAVVNAPEQCVASKWYEVTKFYCTQNLGYGSTAMVMSKGVWDNLPSDIRAAFSQAIPEWLPQVVAFYKDIEVQAVNTMKAANVEVYALDPAEAARWIKLQTPVVDAWVAKTEAPGVPAKAMVEAIRKSAPK
jgi:TRAP-type C4-dicarboxylate transport system substrate-binding protein